MWSNWYEMLVFPSISTTRFMVSEHSGALSNEMVQKLVTKGYRDGEVSSIKPRIPGSSVMWRVKLKIANLVLFQDASFAGELWDSLSTSGGLLCIFGSHTFVPISWMCKKQSAVSHSSAESEIISVDAGLPMDGLPALPFGRVRVGNIVLSNGQGGLCHSVSFTFWQLCILSPLTVKRIPPDTAIHEQMAT